VHEILSDLEVTIQEKQADIKVGALPVIDAIPSQMRQVFQNLISNSLKFSKKDVAPKITIASKLIAGKGFDSPEAENGNYCRLEVTDNGIGFSEEYLDRIFTIFQRLNAPDKFEGTGIGLAIAKKVIEKHNGLITATGRENEGATFILILPLKQN
jgi:two-component system CheB/CheR fusion protein